MEHTSGVACFWPDVVKSFLKNPFLECGVVKYYIEKAAPNLHLSEPFYNFFHLNRIHTFYKSMKNYISIKGKIKSFLFRPKFKALPHVKCERVKKYDRCCAIDF